MLHRGTRIAFLELFELNVRVSLFRSGAKGASENSNRSGFSTGDVVKQSDELSSLYELAELCGVQTRYEDASGVTQSAPPESLLSVIPLLGTPIERISDVPEALKARR